MTGRAATDNSTINRLGLPWQNRSLEYLKLIPELNFCSRFYAKMLAKLRIFPGTMDAAGHITPIESGPPVEELARIQDAGGGRSQLQAAYGRLMFAPGEGYLFCPDYGSEEEKWLFVWKDELRITDDEIVWWQYSGGASARTFTNGGNAVAYRMWLPSPGRSGEAESPVQAIVEGGIAEELIELSAAARSTSVSRLLNGAVKIPSELSFGPIDAVGDEDPENNPFMQAMIETVTARKENPGSAAAASPIFIDGAAEFLKDVTWIPLHDPQNDYMEQGLRKECIERIARGLDMPPEWLLGMGQANHWSSRQILSDMWPSHGEPIGQQWCNDLNLVYLRPALKARGYEGWQDVVIGKDASEIVVNPNQADDANAAHDRITISDKAYRQKLNFKEDDAPDKDEYQLRMAIKMRDQALIPADDMVPGLRGPPPGDAQTPANAGDGPPTPGPEGVSRQEAARIVGAAELAVIRCRELAGSRIRSNNTKCPDCLEPANGQPNALVAALVGLDALSELGTPPPAKLVRGGTDSFRTLLHGWGIDPLQTDLLATLIEDHAAKTLTHPVVQLPTAFVEAVTGPALEHQAA